MPAEPFAYGIQAPIGSVTPLFHKLKDAEDYVAKLTDSRDEAKIIPLYRDAVLTDAEREVLGKACDLADYAGFHSTTRAVLRGLMARLGGK